MATKLPDIETPNPFDTIAEKIEEMINTVIQFILKRREKLLVQLSDHRSHYDNLVASRSVIEKELLNFKRHTESITRNELKEMQDKMLSDIEDKLSKLTSSVTSFELDFKVDIISVRLEIRKLGKISTFNTPKYSKMKTPAVGVARQGKRRHELDQPRGVAFENKSGLIFVCDSYNSCVKVFDSTGEFVDDFGSKQLFRPWGILLHRNYIYVTDIEIGSLFKYRRSNYQFLLSVGKNGNDMGDFNCPGQLAIGHNGCLYVPERGNDRISVLDTKLNFKRHFKHEKIVKPVDVKFTEDMMLVLTAIITRTLCSFNLEGDLIKCFSLLKVEGIAYFFAIDCIGNVLISDLIDHSVFVFSRNGELLKPLCSIGKEGDKIGELHSPYGICTTTGDANLIVASNNRNCGLQIF